MAVRIPWDKYEVALLLEYTVKVEEGVVGRNEAVSIVSKRLRKRAIDKGYAIDNVFRNENGISMQMSALRNCYLGLDYGLSISKLFREIVALYKSDSVAYESILREEQEEMNTSVWQEFLLWLKDMYPTTEKETLTLLSTVNMFGMKSRALSKPIGEITDEAEIEALQTAVAKPAIFGFHSKKTAGKASRAVGIYLAFLRTRNSCEATDKEAVAEHREDVCGEIVDFSANNHYAHTKPIRCEYRKQLINCSGWNSLFINLVKAFYKDYSSVFPVGKSLSSSTRIDIGRSTEMIYPKEIADGIYLECNVSATGVVNKIRALMIACNIAQEDVAIYYCRAGQQTETATEKEKTPSWSPCYTKELSELLTVHYQYGFRMGSPIEMMRLRNYAECDGIVLPESDEELELEIKAAGVLIDGKLFALSSTLLAEVGAFVDNIFSGGACVIFTEVLMDKHLEWFEERLIISKDMLMAILRKCRPEFYFGQNIITAGKKESEHDAVVRDILRVGSDSPIILFKDLEETLPYIPPEKIAWSLSVSQEFVWVSEGKYFIMSHFLVNDSDREAILSFVEEECDNKGYASITDLPFGNIPDDNYHLSVTALYSAVFISILQGEYFLHGKIITKEASGVDITTLLKAFCVGRDECSVTEVLERAVELTGSVNKQCSMEALYETLIRAETDRFVSEKQVCFDIDSVDDILESFIGERFAPIKSINSFAVFPVCGLTWNHYVLESFCYRFSNKYRLVVMNYNDKNAGVIMAKGLSLSYTDVLCEAAADSGVELTPEAIGSYFFDSGFTAKRKYSNLTEIIERARNIREER